MNNKLLLSLVALVLSLVVAGAYFLDKHHISAAGELGPGSQSEGIAPLAPASGELAAVAAPEAEPERKAVQDAAPPPVGKVVRKQSRLPKDVCWVEGRIVFPAKLPSDAGDVEVTARGRRFGGKNDPRREYAVGVSREGRFRVAFSSSTRRGWIDVEGRYLYMAEKLSLKMSELPPEVVVEPKLGGVARGRLKAPPGEQWNDETVAGGKVTLSKWSGGRWAKTVPLEPGGSFEITAVPPSTSYNLSVHTALWMEHEESGVTVKSGEVTELEGQVAKGAKVRGKIVGRAGEPLAEVSVELMCDPTEGSWHHQTVQTEADGVFLFRGVVPGEVVLTATAQGSLAVKKELGLLREGDVRGGVTIELDQGRSISGIVRWGDGTPAGDAWVTIEQDKDARTIAMMIGKKDSQRTAADGSFTISGLEDTICVVRASSRAVLSADKKRSEEARAKGRRGLLRRRGSTHRIKLEDIQPGTTGLILVLEPGDRVTGKAVDDLGEPISRFLISAEPQTGGPSTLDKDDGFQRIVITLDGSFAVDGLRDGAWVLSAHADDHASSEKVVITSPGAGEVEFVLPRHGRVHGIVRGPGGDPVSGANVQMEAAAEGEPQTIEIMYGNWGGKATTDGEGRFEAKDIAPGRKAVYATSEDFGQGLPSYITVEPGATLEGVALRLRSPAGILGQVHGAVGQVARREITIRGQDGVNHRETVTSDSSGRFEVEGLSPGKYRLQLQAPEEPEGRVAGSGLVQAYVSSSREDLYQNAIQFVVLEEGDRERVVLGAPLSNPVQVSGRVTSAGEPVPGHQVHCTSEVDRSRNRATVVTDSEGQYSLTVAGQGSYIFRIGSGRNTTESTHELSQATCRIDFELPAGSFSGSLLGAGGEAIEKGNLKLVRYQDTAGEAVPQKARAVSSASDGSFEFEYIEPGRYFLRASDSPRWAWNQDHGEDLGAVLIDDLVFAEGESRSGFEVQLEIGGLVTGTVLGADGQGLSGAKLKLTTSSGHELSSRRTSRSDWSGGFSISGVGPGTYFLQAQKNGVKSQAQKVHISSSSEVSVQLVLDTE